MKFYKVEKIRHTEFWSRIWAVYPWWTEEDKKSLAIWENPKTYRCVEEDVLRLLL